MIIALLILSIIFTLIHTKDEIDGKLWVHFGLLAKREIPRGFGFLVFGPGLLLASLGLSAWAYLTLNPILMSIWLARCMADPIFSHLIPHALKFRPNPGLGSSLLLFLEAFLIVWFIDFEPINQLAFFLTVLFYASLWTVIIPLAGQWLGWRKIKQIK